MDKYTGKRTVGGVGVTGRGTSQTFSDASNHKDGRSNQYCNRLGCSTRPNSMKDTHIGISYFRSSSGKSVFGSSSKSYPALTDKKKSLKRPQSVSSKKESVSAATSMQIEKSSSELLEFNDTESGSLKSADDTSVSSEEVSSSSADSRKPLNKRNLENSVGGPRCSFASKNTNQTARTSNGQGVNSSQYGLRNLACTSISDVLNSGRISSNSARGRKADNEKLRRSVGESSSRGKVVGGSSSGDYSRKATSVRTRSLSRAPSQATSRYKYWTSSGDSVRSVRTRRTISGEITRSRISEPSVTSPDLSRLESSLNRSSSPSSSQQSSQYRPTIRRTSTRQAFNINETVRNRPTTRAEDHSVHPLNSLSDDHDGFSHFNIGGIAEVLLALERIEQDQELTYEQLFALETNLFMGGLSFQDQHREMRLDIDDMSYEELLALGDEMGNVSTALTDEEMSKCLRKSCYVPPPSDARSLKDDVKCCICQEEYVDGDETGKLKCDHQYHVVCIDQWLRMKNWCPICKAHAAAS